MKEHCSKLNSQLSHSMFFKNITRLPVAREHHLVTKLVLANGGKIKNGTNDSFAYNSSLT